ncbi:GDSL-type esterase/lipase family protein [Aneurinibacillus tyrosinisolvens]|uniref:GDSL-type esterase/lipase family protein n=1 Tax=Aneurinibacillus tyrosinisolvens TaxID=1443435 RepID=UPI000A72B1D1|nr:GDSL-type esterase/lipase family protein [Aneurinibacillus tyrosinisolvens]
MGTRDILYPSQKQWEVHKEVPQQGLGGKNKLQIVALGDSLTRGTGDESGLGYVGNMQAGLAEKNKRQVFVLNHGVIGYKTANLLADLQSKEDIRRSIRQADIVTLSIGGNDLFNVGAEDVRPDVIRKRIPEAASHYEKIIRILKQLNPNAPLLYVGLYNAFADLPNGTESSVVVREWNGRVAEILSLHPKGVFIPTDDLFHLGLAKYLSSDHFHPNQAGYKRIGQRMAGVLE